MRVTRLTHSCVRFQHDGRVLVVDPGVWSEADVLADADAVLLTHEHTDHADLERLRTAQVQIVAPHDAVLPDVKVDAVGAGEAFTIAGFAITAVGGVHAPVLPGQRPCANLGYVVEDAAYHTGEALHVPDVDVETLLVPMHGSWLTTSAAVEFIRRVGPRRAIGIHDGQINDRGVMSVGHWLGSSAAVDYRWVPPGTDL